MSKGASIPRLLRIHFSGIGHPDARLSPLTLDFSREGDQSEREVLDSVIWAENGVGKSSIRALLFSLLHPSIHDVMKSSNGPLDNRKYELFFGPKDSSYVVTEWLLPPRSQPTLVGLPEEAHTLVVGFAAHWPRNHQTTLSDLDRHFFMFEPEGTMTFDRLPIRGLSRGVEPVVHAKEFMEWFKEQVKPIGGRHTTIHREWSNWLADAGLDPVLFAYQLRMNGGQGGILGLFKNRINSSTDFVHFFLETVLNHEAANDVVEVLNEKKAHIEKKPQWEAEVSFVEQALPLLEALTEQKGAYESAGQAVRRDRGRAGALIVGLGQSEQTLKHRLEETRNQTREIEDGVEKWQRRFVAFQDYRSWLRYHESALAFDQAENDVAQARRKHDESRRQVALLKAALEYAAWQEKLDECKAIETELQDRDDANLDVEVALRNAGATLASVLTREIEETKERLGVAKEAVGEARKTLMADQKEFNRTKTELGKVKEVIRGVNAQMQNREKVLRRLVLSQVLRENEAPTDAVTRWKQRLSEAGTDVSKAVELRRVSEEERAKLQERQHDHVVRLTRTRAEVDDLTKTLEVAETKRTRLERHTDLEQVAEEQPVNLANPDLPDLIRERLVGLQQEIFDQNRRLADDRDTLAAIEQSESKLYPPPREVAKLLRVIREDLNVSASLGVEALDAQHPDDPETAEAMFSQDPARFMGILTHSPEALAKIREHADTLLRPAFPVQISLSGSALSTPPEDAVVLRPGHQAAFNRKAATSMIEPLKRGITEKERRIAEYQQTSTRLQQALTDLEAFLAQYPGAKLSDLRDKVERKRVVLKDLENIQQNDRDRLALIERQLRDAADAIKDGESLRQQAESAIDRLRDFIEDHESQFAEARAKLMDARAQLHMQEDKSMRLEASLEEDQRLVGERQERVFEFKNRWDRRKQELSELTYKDGESQATEGTTLSEAETAYKLNFDRFKQISEKDETLRARLEEKRNMAGDRERRYRKELGEYSDQDAAAVLGEGRVEERLAAAEQKERNAGMALGAAEGALNAARDSMREAPTLSMDYEPPEGEALPETAAEAHQRRRDIENQLETWRQEIDGQKERLIKLKETMGELGDDINLRKYKREELVNHVPDFAEDEAASLPVGNAELETELETFWAAFRKHRKAYSDHKVSLDKSCDKLKDLANSPKYQDFPNDKREILKLRESLLRQTEEIIKEFHIFREVIQSSLRMSEESTEAIVTRLDAHINDALHLIHLSRSSSRLPEAMEGWGGLSFLKIDLLAKVPGTIPDRKPVYERVLREALQTGNALRGLDLIKRGVDALAGVKGYRVEIMKPGYSLKTDYHPVTNVKGWSDGEKITSVILLYCTMVQLRALSMGGKADDDSRVHSNGMLFLDNPFGEANSLTFVNMQLTMARALNIQLVYTASGAHKHLMARFPRVIRLSQEIGENKTFVKATDVGGELRSAVNVTAAHFGRRRVG